MLSYLFFPAFFIRAAYATFARSDAARRMAKVHRADLELWVFGSVVAVAVRFAVVRRVPARDVPCNTSIARVSLSLSAMSKDRI